MFEYFLVTPSTSLFFLSLPFPLLGKKEKKKKEKGIQYIYIYRYVEGERAHSTFTY